MQQQIPSLRENLIALAATEYLLSTVQPLVVQQGIDPPEILAALVTWKPLRLFLVNLLVRFQIFHSRKPLPTDLTLESFAMLVPLSV